VPSGLKVTKSQGGVFFREEVDLLLSDSRLPHSMIAAVVSPEGRTVVVAGNFDEMLIWNTQVEGLPRIIETQLGSSLTDMAISPDGKRVVAMGNKGRSGVWDVETGERLFNLDEVGNYIMDGRVYFTPDGKKIVTKTDWRITIWDFKGNELHAISNSFKDSSKNDKFGAISFSADGTRIRIFDYLKREAIVYSMKTGAQLQRSPVLKHNMKKIEHATFLPDGEQFLTISEFGTVAIWDAVTGARKKTLSSRIDYEKKWSIHPNGRYLLASSKKGKVQLIDIEDNTSKYTLQGNVGIFSQDGKQILTFTEYDEESGSDLWDTETGKLIMHLPKTRSHISGAIFSHDGSFILQHGVGEAFIVRTNKGAAEKRTQIHKALAQKATGASTASAKEQFQIDDWRLGATIGLERS